MNIYHENKRICSICQIALKPSPNSLSLHIRTHNISKEDYYLKYICSTNICKKCGNLSKFINIEKGFHTFCPKCQHQNQWEGEQGILRKEKARQKQLNHPMGGGGRPLGSKNINPYPQSKAKIKHMLKLGSMLKPWNKSPDKIDKNKIHGHLKQMKNIKKF